MIKNFGVSPDLNLSLDLNPFNEQASRGTRDFDLMLFRSPPSLKGGNSNRLSAGSGEKSHKSIKIVDTGNANFLFKFEDYVLIWRVQRRLLSHAGHKHKCCNYGRPLVGSLFKVHLI